VWKFAFTEVMGSAMIAVVIPNALLVSICPQVYNRPRVTILPYLHVSSACARKALNQASKGEFCMQISITWFNQVLAISEEYYRDVSSAGDFSSFFSEFS
jgi:hypothetical protein